MTIRFAFVAAAMALTLAGCENPETTQQLASACANMGYRTGTPEHAQCMDVYRQVPVTRPIN